MTLHEYVLFDPLFSDADAEGMVDLCQRFGRYGMYSAENEGITGPRASSGARDPGRRRMRPARDVLEGHRVEDLAGV